MPTGSFLFIGLQYARGGFAVSAGGEGRLGSGTLAIIAVWCAGVAGICRDEPFGTMALGAAVALATASLLACLG